MQRFAGKPTRTPAAFLFGDVQAPHACAGNHGLDRDPCLFEAGSGRLSGTALRQLRTRRPTFAADWLPDAAFARKTGRRMALTRHPLQPHAQGLQKRPSRLRAHGVPLRELARQVVTDHSASLAATTLLPILRNAEMAWSWLLRGLDLPVSQW